MKRSTLIGCLLILNIAFAQAVFLKKPINSQLGIFSQLQQVEQNPLGKRLLETIALQITNKTPLGQVSKVITDIKEDLQNQQSAADTLHGERGTECQNEFARLTGVINEATGVRDDSRDNIALLNQEIEGLIANIANKDKQIQIIGNKSADLEAARQRDASAYITRKAESEQVLEALNLIVEKLNGIHAENSSEQVFAQLARIGSTNPILSLVSVASTFSQGSLDGVTGKLNGLIESINASLSEDASAENKAISDYSALAGELASTHGSLVTLRSNLSSELIQKKASHSFHTGRFNDAVITIAENNDLLNKKHDQCTNWNNVFNNETDSRNNEIQLVDSVLNLVATKLETMKDYLKAKAEQ